MHHSNTFDFFGHIREELPDLQTGLIDLFRLPAKRKRNSKTPNDKRKKR